MYRIIMLAALMLSVMGGLAVMLGSSPLAAQTTAASATRSFSPSTVVPGGEVMVTIAVADNGGSGGVTETLPEGFAYVEGSAAPLDDFQVVVTGQNVRFTLQGERSFTYTVTASSTEGSYPFEGSLRDSDRMDSLVGGATEVTVAADDGTTPDPTATATPDALAIPDLDTLNPDAQVVFTAGGMEGNDLVYTAEVDEDTDAKVAVRVSPGVSAIIDIDLDMAEITTDQQVNFSLTDGEELGFQIKKTSQDTAEIVVKEGATLASGQHNFKLVVNEYLNAPANTEDVDIEVTVVIDNAAPEWTVTPVSGTVPERAKGEVIETFSATDINNQVLSFEVTAKETRSEALVAGLEIGNDGMLKTTDAVESPDQPDYVEDDPATEDVDESAIEDDPATEDVDESGDANEHVLVITVSDGTLSVDHEFTLTVTDEDDPAPGSRQILPIDENNAGGLENEFGTGPALGGSGDFSIGEQVNSAGEIAGSENPEDILFDVDPESGKVFLKVAGTIDYESEITSYTLSISRGNVSGIVVVKVQDVNEAPKFSASDKAKQSESESDNIVLFVLESAAIGTVVSIGQDAGNNPTAINATFTASDEDSVARGNAIAYDLWYDHDNDDETPLALYAGADAMFSVDNNGTIKVSSMLDTDADTAEPTIDLVLRAVDAGEQGDPPVLGSPLHDALNLRVTVIDTNVAPEFDGPSRAQTHATVSEGAAVGTVVHTYRATDEDGDTVRYRLRDEDDAPFFSVEETLNTAGEEIGILKTAAGLDYETNTSHTVEIQAYDTDGDTDEIVITVDVTNANDNSPAFGPIPADPIRVSENSPRGTSLGSFAATDADGDDVTYSLSGADAKSFHIDGYGELKTLESLDFDSNTPCPRDGGCCGDDSGFRC